MNMTSILQFVEGQKIVFFMFIDHNRGLKGNRPGRYPRFELNKREKSRDIRPGILFFMIIVLQV